MDAKKKKSSTREFSPKQKNTQRNPNCLVPLPSTTDQPLHMLEMKPNEAPKNIKIKRGLHRPQSNTTKIEFPATKERKPVGNYLS